MLLGKRLGVALIFTGVTLSVVGLFRPQTGWTMGWVERKLRGDEFWENLEKAKPLIRARADALLQQLGYDPTSFTVQVGLGGEGEGVWEVAYWRQLPEDLVERLKQSPNILVNLNNRGEVKWAFRYDDDQAVLIYGKDERIRQGMTPQEVVERLGEPESKGLPPRKERDLGDEVWKYQKNQHRTIRIEIWFKDGKVKWYGESG